MWHLKSRGTQTYIHTYIHRFTNKLSCFSYFLAAWNLKAMQAVHDMHVANFGNKWSIPQILFYSLCSPQPPPLSWEACWRYSFNFTTVFHPLRPWSKSHSVCIKCTVIFLSAFLADEFREEAAVWRVLVRYKGLEPYSLFLSGKIKCTLCTGLFQLCNKEWEI